MKRVSLFLKSAVAPLALLSVLNTGCEKATSSSLGASAPASPDLVARGRYLIAIGGCNDCHTPEYMAKGNAVPEDDWLTGVPVGWRGPWGTSYGSNLRVSVPAYDVENWIAMVRSRNGLPPMPWTALHAMTDEDLRAVHAYICSLGPKGEPTPPPLPPDEEPKTPWLNLTPVTP